MKVPKLALLLAETASAIELPRLFWRWPELSQQPRGNDEPVMVLPGFGADDSSTIVLRRYLQTLGYKVCGWGLGFNRGDIPGIFPRVADAVKRCADEAGERVRLVGWSLGGVIAREIARDDPDMVERVVTMGSPVCGGFKYTSGHWWYRLCRYDLDKLADEAEERNRRKLKVPVTAIYAAWDGIVWRRACFDKWSTIEHIEVATTHLGLGFNADVYRIIAQRFAVPTVRRQRARTRTQCVREIGPVAMRKAS